MVTPQLYQGIINNMAKELLEFQEAANIVNLTDVSNGDDPTVSTEIQKYLMDIGQASLSAELWDPTKTRPDVNLLSMSRLSCDIEEDIKFEDWKTFSKMNVWDSNLVQVGNKPAVQASHYLIQGTKLLNDLTKGGRPFVRAGQYNFALDVGANSLASTITRPIGCNQVTGTPNTWTATAGAWSTYASMATDINQVETLFSQGFNRETTYCFFPNIASPGFGKKRTTAGDGFRNAYMELEDHGIPRERCIALDDRYCYTVASAAPTLAAFDMYFIDMKSIKTKFTVTPFVNPYLKNEKSKFSDMVVEAGLTMINIFKPRYNPSNQKWYKGVSVVRAINGT